MHVGSVKPWKARIVMGDKVPKITVCVSSFMTLKIKLQKRLPAKYPKVEH